MHILDELLTLLEHEKSLLKEMVALASSQQEALIKFKADESEELANYQLQVAEVLKQTEERRLKALMNSMQLTRREASSMTISSLKESLTGERIGNLSAMQLELRNLTHELHQINLTNRVLAHRARTSIQEILSVFNSDGVRVCNVTV